MLPGRRPLFLGCFATALGLAACLGPDDDAASSEAAHTSGSYTQDNSPFYWASEDYAQFRDGQSALGQYLPSALDDTHALTQRIQTWLDRIDAIVRPEVAARTGKPLAAPRPIAKVLASRATFNAWVSGTAVCLGAPLGETAPGSRSLVHGANVFAFPGTVCARPDWSLPEFVRFSNAGRKPACSLMLANGVLSLDRRVNECMIDPGAENAEDAMVVATSPYIQFTTDLVAELKESTLAAVAAHELGHYYLAHGTAKGAASYGYWYVTDGRSTRTPARAPNSAELEAAYAEVMQDRPAAVAFGERYSARLRPLLIFGLAPLLAERTEPDFACREAHDRLGDWTTRVGYSEAPPEEDRASFVAFERALAACAPRLGLGEAGRDAVSAGSVLLAAGQSRPGPKVKISMRLDDSLGSFLDRLDAQAKELDAKAARLVERARANGLGLYTTEQSADDFMLELSTKLGFTSEEVLAAWVDFMRASNRTYERVYTAEELEAYRAQTGEPTTDACEAMLRQDFQSTDGSGRATPIPVSLGDLASAHHSSCYRLFNLWREARAHRYEPGPRPSLLPEAEWERLRAEASTLSASAEN